MREIVLDTETTGLSPSSGHRVIEIGCVELYNRIPTGKTYQAYINPQREVSAEAAAVSGLTTEFLKPFPVFGEIVDSFLDFIRNDFLVIHNASFDMGFLNAELERLKRKPLHQNPIIDTLKIARSKFPGSPASLDALCKRFKVDSKERTFHGALLDSTLLAKVYLELCGGRQQALVQEAQNQEKRNEVSHKSFREARPHGPSQTEEAAHQEFLGLLKDPLWKAG